ncbi:MAG TPA: DUF2249 domain-containing protein [Saprospiraceae bacterium]|nr:DUF2249 domain-containing protein [Saprospiraceae bacterium]
MKINQNTKISKLLKANPEAIEVIAGINKHFRKLKNPILRKALAPRVTIKEAAKIGGVPVGIFLRKLQEIGFEIDEEIPGVEETATKSPKNSLKDITPALILDVRPDIEAGVDPFKRIMSSIKELKAGDVVKVINSFEPIPLINLLRQKGFTPEVERPEAGVVITYLQKGEKAETPDPNQAPPPHKDDFDSVVQAFGDDLKVIDVRMMEMPEPMVTVLSELEVLPPGHGLLVHHKKFPKFLISELTTRGYQLIDKPIDSNRIDLIIFKVK